MENSTRTENAILASPFSDFDLDIEVTIHNRILPEQSTGIDDSCSCSGGLRPPTREKK
ncbi:hypothetical protein [Thermosporothrix hazakensis]|uniref:hypothetical protein n=1 Tax=Thermosporothrix hazakensis TaxID=644383 RepID=UPI0014747BE0|nr:hypothetical protein [Thermosporothrix hazakensis]